MKAFVDSEYRKISPVVIGMTDHITSELSDVSRGLVYRCNDSVKISYDNTKIQSVRFNGIDVKSGETYIIQGVCSPNNELQTLSGYMVLNDSKPNEIQPDQVIPFFLNRTVSADKSSINLVISQALKVDSITDPISSDYRANLFSNKYQVDGLLNPDRTLTFPSDKNKTIEIKLEYKG
jgi:hypothetical protein